jgi:microsomal prostaglandin-E synthase 1
VGGAYHRAVDLTRNPAFAIYGLTAAVLCLNLLGLWGYSGVVRTGTKTTPNTEDAVTVAKGAEVVKADPDAVARVLRAHTNAFVNIVPFLALGLLYVLLGASATMAWILFGGFALTRLGHTFAYLGQKQPWRTVMFVLSSTALGVVLIEVARRSVALL